MVNKHRDDIKFPSFVLTELYLMARILVLYLYDLVVDRASSHRQGML